MTERILLVDDDPLCLAVWQRTLGDLFALDTAEDPLIALSQLADGPGYAVIVSDIRMPGMDGIEFLKRTVDLSPDSVRLVLTADEAQGTAARAINDCRVFRFLTKPCSRDAMAASIRDALAQYRMQQVERDLLDQSVKGCVAVLTDILAMANPDAFGRANQLREFVVRICRHVRVERPWEVEIAAMLSQLGRVTLPPEMLAKQQRGEPLGPEEKMLIAHHPTVAARLIRQIPRLESVAALVQSAGDASETGDTAGGGPPSLEVRILRAATAMQDAIGAGLEIGAGLQRLRQRRAEFGDDLLDAMSRAFSFEAMSTRTLRFEDLESGMLLAEPLMSSNGMVLVQKGARVSEVTLTRLHNFVQKTPIKEPVLVFESV